MEMDPLPPVAGNDGGWPLISISHFDTVGAVTDEDVELQVAEARVPARTTGSKARRHDMARNPPREMHAARQPSGSDPDPIRIRSGSDPVPIRIRSGSDQGPIEAR
jgi:hypothetical protein